MPPLARRLLLFTRRVIVQFYRNKGLLLASAVAFNALMSLIPLLGLVLVILSAFIDSTALLSAVESTVEAVVPRAASQITDAIREFLQRRAVASGVGGGVVVFFSAMAFRTLDDALSSIFEPHITEKKRHPVLSMALPLIFMGLVVMALVVISLLVTTVDMLPTEPWHVFGFDLSLVAASRKLVRGLGFVGLVALLASFYRVMPEAKVSFKQAVIGGLVAAILWEGMRRTLSWYFANVSLVGVIYGSLTTVIVMLLTFETAAVILLLGGQVIAEIVRSQERGLPWYEAPKPSQTADK